MKKIQIKGKECWLLAEGKSRVLIKEDNMYYIYHKQRYSYMLNHPGASGATRPEQKFESMILAVRIFEALTAGIQQNSYKNPENTWYVTPDDARKQAPIDIANNIKDYSIIEKAQIKLSPELTDSIKKSVKDFNAWQGHAVIYYLPTLDIVNTYIYPDDNDFEVFRIPAINLYEKNGFWGRNAKTSIKDMTQEVKYHIAKEELNNVANKN